MDFSPFIIVGIIIAAVVLFWIGLQIFIKFVASLFAAGVAYWAVGNKWQDFFDGDGFYSFPFGGYDAGWREMVNSYGVWVIGCFVFLMFGGFVIGMLIPGGSD